MLFRSFSILKIFSNYFFARNDTQTPFYTSVISVILNIIISVSFFNKIGFVIIPIATSISSWVNVFLHFYFIKKRNLYYFDKIFVCGAEDVDYRIRCAIKGYDVNFLSDSYLLHFHGKSSWDGVETNKQIEARNKLYTESFLKKWGKDLTQIFIFRKNFSNILDNKGIAHIFKQGKFGELIRELLK